MMGLVTRASTPDAMMASRSIRMAAVTAITGIGPRIEAARINPKLNDALRRELPPKITDDQARQMHDVFLEATVDTLKRFVSKKRDLDLMAELTMEALTHGAVLHHPEWLGDDRFG